MRRWAGALAGLVVVVSGLAGCGRDDGPGDGQGWLAVDGSATVERPDGSTLTVTGTEDLAFGDVVTLDDGTATLTLAAGQVYELRSGDAPSQVEIGAPPTLVAGDVLVREGFPAQVRHDTATISALGPLKVDAEVPRAVSYAGTARIAGVGQLEEVRGLRQVVLTPAAVPEPLTYDGADAWDRRYLGEAVVFGERLEALARGYTADLGAGGGRSASFFEAVLPALDEEREFGADLLDPERPVGETLIGAAIAVEGRDGTFRERWDEVFAFRDAGAAWGLVALDQGVSSAPLLETIELAVTAPTTQPPSTDPPSTSTSEPSPTSSPPTTAGGPTTTDPPPTTSEPPSSPPVTGILDPIVDPLGDILDELLGVLGLG